jgi:Flp pilus assembly protein TadG
MATTPFGVGDNQQSDVLFQFTDIEGNPALAPTIDPGSVIATASDPAALFVIPNADLSGVTVQAEGPLDADVTVNVSFTVAGVLWSGSETFAVDATGPTTLLLVPQAPTDNPVPTPAPAPAPTPAPGA